MSRLIRSVCIAMLGLAAACARGDRPSSRPEARQRLQAVLQRADSTTIASLIAGDTIHLSQATVEFYRARRYRLAWLHGDELTRQGKRVARVLGSTERDGLSPLRYRYDVLRRMVVSLGADGGSDDGNLDAAAKAKYAADVDLLLTEAFTRYALDLAQGTLDPESAGLEWRIPRGSLGKGRVLRALARGADPAAMINRIRPHSPQYARLMKALARFSAARSRGGWPMVPDGEAKRGDSSDVVVKLRQRLMASEDAREAWLASRGRARPAVFDHDLWLGLRHFQQRNGIDADGAFGAKTLQELNYTVDDRIAEIKINLDRWRWLPHELGRMYVLVNVAGFELAVVQNSRTIEEMNVVVGQEGWETPIFADTLERLIVNPYWNVPPSIVEEEMANLADDPMYLVRNNFERTPDGGLRQRPGPRNALGKFKFEFPNQDNIYLHDTPADQLFSRTSRAFSHGCIRLENPRELAYLLADKLAGKSPQQVDRLVDTGQTRTINFRHRIPIYILYFTTWVNDDGTVRFHHDVYGHDEALRKQTHRFETRTT